MKVLMLSAADRMQHGQFLLTGLRQNIGTCEYFPLTKPQQNNIEQFFSSFITLQRFDRIIMELPQEVIYRQSLFLRGLPFMASLNLNQPYDRKERTFLKSNLKAMPWLRVVTDDLNLYSDLIGEGVDTAWITPSLNPNAFKPKNQVSSRNRVIVFDPSGVVRPVYETMFAAKYSSQEAWDMWEFCDAGDDLSIRINSKDIFIYWPDSLTETPTPMIEAVNCGAAIVCPDFGVHINKYYQWRNEHNCLFVNTVDTALETAMILLEEYEFRAKLSRHSLEGARRFSALAAGEELGEALKPDIRKSSDYRRRVRIFGLEI
ncbi:MAG: hypothetical protein J6M05_00240 [Cardiobacteriaceae bacterium]|nr:hypothetical protein [Cardiobacteriaceae bacterium]